MYISTDSVNRDGLANVINLYAYQTVANTDNIVDCFACAYDGYGLDEWFFVFVGNVLQSDVYCNDCFKKKKPTAISLPTKGDDPAFEYLLDVLIGAGGVYLPDEQPWIDTVQQFAQQHGKNMQRVHPSTIVYIDNNVPLRKSVLPYYQCTEHLMSELKNMFFDYMENFGFNSYCSRKNFNHAVNDAYDTMNKNMFEENWLINKPLSLEPYDDLKREMLDQFREEHERMFDLEKDEDDSYEYQFDSSAIVELMITFLNQIPPSVYEEHFTKPLDGSPYSNSYAQAAYDIADWRPAPV